MTGSRAGVRARYSATNCAPKRARSSLGWDHAAAAKVRHCEGCSEARVHDHSLPAGAIGFPSRSSFGGKVGEPSRPCEVPERGRWDGQG